MTPFVFESRVLPSYAVPNAPVRECPLCPPWVECAHYGDYCVRLSCRTRTGHTCQMAGWHVLEDWKVQGPFDVAHVVDCPECGARNAGVFTFAYTGHPTEADARAEFERRVALMLEAE